MRQWLCARPQAVCPATSSVDSPAAAPSPAALHSQITGPRAVHRRSRPFLASGLALGRRRVRARCSATTHIPATWHRTLAPSRPATSPTPCSASRASATWAPPSPAREATSSIAQPLDGQVAAVSLRPIGLAMGGGNSSLCVQIVACRILQPWSMSSAAPRQSACPCPPNAPPRAPRGTISYLYVSLLRAGQVTPTILSGRPGGAAGVPNAVPNLEPIAASVLTNLANEHHRRARAQDIICRTRPTEFGGRPAAFANCASGPYQQIEWAPRVAPREPNAGV